jgi:hypothetical protein
MRILVVSGIFEVMVIVDGDINGIPPKTVLKKTLAIQIKCDPELR